MIYYTIRPPAELSQFVRFYWVMEGNEEACPYVYRSLADGCAEFIFHYKGSFHELDHSEKTSPGLAHVHAQSSRFKRFITNDAFGIFGVYLYPYAIPQLLNTPSHVLSNSLTGFEELFPAMGKEIEEKIMLAQDNQERARIISALLIRLSGKSKVSDAGICHAIKRTIYQHDIRNVKDLASQYCLSERQFERKFKEHAGFSPKSYLRIIRFQNAIKQYQGSFRTLSDLAHSCGYYDQAHFIHDFKEFSGFHPKTYFSGGAEGSEYRDC